MSKRLSLEREGKLVRLVNIKCHYSIPILTFPLIFLSISRSIFNPRDLDDLYISLLLIVISVAIIYFFVIRKIIYNIDTKKYGEKVKAKVLGYYDDYAFFHEESSQLIELSIKTLTGDKIIGFSTTEKYEVGSEIELLIYNDKVLIVDDKYNKIEKIHNIIVITLLSLVVCVYFSDFIVYKIINTTYHDIKMSVILKTNKEIMNNIDDLEYKIPDGYKLVEYEKGYHYDFESKTDNHYCGIAVYSRDASGLNIAINSCPLNRKEELINGSIWCYNKMNNLDYYSLNDGKHYYIVYLNTHWAKDEQCAIDFSNFLETIKVNN